MTAVFRDPIHDGAADPVLARRTGDPTYWMLYTNRRADAPEGQGVAWVHGTDLGLASSTDGGATWLYRGVVEGLDHEPGRNTFWAPEVVWAEGCFHLYVSYVTGVPERWEGHPRSLHHYTSDDILHWRHHGPVVPSLTQIIDACVYPLPYGGYRILYFTHPPGDRDVFERRRSTIHVATLDAADGELICRRDAETRLRLSLS
jgi:hypothetical protein